MKLNNKQKEILVEKLKKTVPMQCYICSSNKWMINDTVFEIREFHKGSIKVGKTDVIPIISLTCSICGNMIFLNALNLGLELNLD